MVFAYSMDRTTYTRDSSEGHMRKRERTDRNAQNRQQYGTTTGRKQDNKNRKNERNESINSDK